jgi:dTDP-4-dehydrorhamnose reductase
MINVLVTGSEGQLGQCLQKIAHKYPQITFIFKDKSDLDITDKNNVQTVFKEHELHFCINCAAYTNVEQAEKTPGIAFAVNADGVRNLAIVCKENNVKLIHISTDYVFDGEKKEGYYPSDKPNPINEYGKSKLLGEQYIQEILQEFIIIRTSWLYSEFGHNFYKTILEKAKRKETISVTNSQVGCPTNANNLASYIMNIISNHEFKSGIQHLTDGEAMSWYAFAKKIIKDHKLDSEAKVVKDENYRTFARRPNYSILI